MIYDSVNINSTIKIDKDLYYTEYGSSDFQIISSNIVFIAGFSGTGKSTLVDGLNMHLDSKIIPNRREITTKCIINPSIENFSIAPEVNRRTERLNFVKKFKINNPEGVLYFFKKMYSKINFNSFVFDGIRGEEEIRSAINCFSNSRIIHLTASSSVRKQRLLKRADNFDIINSKIDTNYVLNNDYKLHGNDEIFVDSKQRYLKIDTSDLLAEEVLNHVLNWI